VIPLHDENRTVRTPIVTLALIGLCVVAWFLVQGAGSEFSLAASVCNYGLVPGELLGTVQAGTTMQMTEDLVCVVDPGREPSHLFTHMFLHGSWMHLIGNMWFLWLFGNNIEDSMTRPRFAAFYLLCGLAAAAFQILADQSSAVPMVGASGAISGVMGGYLVLFPRVRVHTLVPLGFILQQIALPAWVMLIYWMVLQLFGGLSSIAAEAEGGVAFWAHVGGFVAGVVLVKLFTTRAHLEAHQAQHWRPSARYLGR
jgi:membrane associated rhomboid family serine protease